MSKIFKLFKFGTLGALDKLGMFSPTEKAIDLLGQDKFVAEDFVGILETEVGDGDYGLFNY